MNKNNINIAEVPVNGQKTIEFNITLRTNFCGNQDNIQQVKIQTLNHWMVNISEHLVLLGNQILDGETDAEIGAFIELLGLFGTGIAECCETEFLNFSVKEDEYSDVVAERIIDSFAKLPPEYQRTVSNYVNGGAR